MRLQPVATSLFTSHIKEATRNCSPVVISCGSVQLPVWAKSCNWTLKHYSSLSVNLWSSKCRVHINEVAFFCCTFWFTSLTQTIETQEQYGYAFEDLGATLLHPDLNFWRGTTGKSLWQFMHQKKPVMPYIAICYNRVLYITISALCCTKCNNSIMASKAYPPYL